MKGFVSFSVSSFLILILFFSDICHLEQIVRFVSGTILFNDLFYSLPYQSAILPSHTPNRCDIVHVPVTKEEELTERGCPELWKGAGQDFLLLWMEPWYPECLMDKDQSQAVCLSHRLWVHLASYSPLQCQTEAPDRGRGSCLQPHPWRLSYQTCVCTQPSGTCTTALSFSSLRKYCVVAGFTLLRSSPCFVAAPENGPVIKIDLLKIIWKEKMPLMYLKNVSVCLSFLLEPAGVDYFSVLGLFSWFWFGKRAHSTTE